MPDITFQQKITIVVQKLLWIYETMNRETNNQQKNKFSKIKDLQYLIKNS